MNTVSGKNDIADYMYKSMVVSFIVAFVILLGMLKTLKHYSMEEYGVFLELSANSKVHSEFLSDYRTCNQSVFSTTNECLSQAITITEKKYPQANLTDILKSTKPYIEYEAPTLFEVLYDTITLKYL